MRINFRLHLTPEETGALMHLFDKDGIGELDCKEFIFNFFRLGRTERDKHFRNRKCKTEIKLAAEKTRVATIKEKYHKLVLCKVAPSTKKDEDSVLQKIRKAALHYNQDSMFSKLRQGFESEDLSPTEFREVLKSNFMLQLSPEELDAAIKLFDANKDGSISCSEFMSRFFQMQIEERSKIFANQKSVSEERMEAEIRRQKSKIAVAVSSIKTRISWPILPPLDSTKVDDDEDDEEEKDQDLKSRSMTDISRASTAVSSRRMSKKPSMADVLPPAFRSRPSTGALSLSTQFPKASEDTKQFLDELEERERHMQRNEIRRQRGLSNSLAVETGLARPSTSLGSPNNRIASL